MEPIHVIIMGKNKKINNSLSSHYKTDQGVALLMTLGMLSLLLVLALSFAFAAMSTLKSVNIAQDIAKSRLQAESGFKRAFELLTENFSDPNDAANIFPATKTITSVFGPDAVVNDWDGRVYWASRDDNYYASDAAETANTPSQNRSGIDTALHVELDGIEFTPGVALDDTFGWIHTYDSSETYIDDTDTPIISRVAFLIIDESGKIDPAPTTENGVTEGTEKRFGTRPAEINITNASTESNLAANLRRGDTSGIPAGGIWFSYYHIFKQLNADSAYVSAAADTDADMAMITKNFFPHSYDKEAYYDGDDDKHRFNLARTDWDSLSISDILKPAEVWSTGSHTATGIPWLGISTDTVLNNQIAANLLDYCDSNTDATSDYSGSGNIPAYCGNDGYYLINEVEIKATLSGDQVTLAFDIELVNFFQVSSPGSSRLFVRGTIGGTELTSENFSSTGTAITPSGNYYEATTITISANTVSSNPADGDDDSDSENITLSNLAVYLENSTDSTKLKDFSELPNPATSITLDTSTPLTANNVIIIYEANDPRYNLKTDAWTQVQTWSTSRTSATNGSVNSSCNPNPGGNKDPEPSVTQPYNVSTAYIRNDKMTYIWELGAVHRGAPWETINLKKYKNVSIYNMSSPDAMFGAYSDGDANILSQVKITNDTETTGYININTYNRRVLISLLEGITIGGAYSDDATPGGTAITSTGAGSIVGTLTPAVSNSILSTNNADKQGNGEVFRFRGQLANATKLFDGTGGTQTTDRQKEEVIGKMIGLTTVRQNYFTVIAVSQMVQDMVAGVGGSGERGHFNEGIDLAYADQTLMALIYRDALRNTVEVLRYEYLNE